MVLKLPKHAQSSLPTDISLFTWRLLRESCRRGRRESDLVSSLAIGKNRWQKDLIPHRRVVSASSVSETHGGWAPGLVMEHFSAFMNHPESKSTGPKSQRAEGEIGSYS